MDVVALVVIVVVSVVVVVVTSIVVVVAVWCGRMTNDSKVGNVVFKYHDLQGYRVFFIADPAEEEKRR